MPPVMRPARSRILLLAKALGVAGVAGAGVWMAGRPGARHATPELLAAAPSANERVVHFEQPTGRRAELAAGSASAAPAARRAGAVAELESEAAAQFVAVCQIKLLAAETDLDLSHRQWARLAAAATQAQAVRLAYEAEIATVRKIAPGRYRVDIPAYAAAGDALRQRFLAELRDSLGEAVAAEVLEKLGAKLEGIFAGFGVSSQTLEISGDAHRAPAEVQVERTAHFWNSAADSDRVTTRREVVLPLADDPTGEAWTPLLALVGKAD